MLWLKSSWLHDIYVSAVLVGDEKDKVKQWINVSKYLLLYVKCFRGFQGKICYFNRRFYIFS